MAQSVLPSCGSSVFDFFFGLFDEVRSVSACGVKVEDHEKRNCDTGDPLHDHANLIAQISFVLHISVIMRRKIYGEINF